MREIRLPDRLRYHFDNIMSKGTISLILWLVVVSLTIVVVVSVVLLVSRVAPVKSDGTIPNLGETLWVSFMETINPGQISSEGGHPLFLFLMLIAGTGGIFIFSALISILTSGLENHLADLRKGRSFVVEENHTIILGWSSQIFLIISELVTTYQDRPRSCIVVLAEKDKVEMEDEISQLVGDTGRTRIVCRTGDCTELNDLELVNPNGSQVIIILPMDGDDQDAHTIKTILALVNHPRRRHEAYNVIAAIQKPENVELAEIVGRHEVQIVLVGDVISRIAVQTCRQPGLLAVYSDLLDFEGDEFYFIEEPRIIGKTFRETLFLYEESSPIGIMTSQDKILINPPMTHQIEQGDRLVLITENNHSAKLSHKSPHGIDETAICPATTSIQPERTLILGWNTHGALIINELDKYVQPGSKVTVVADIGDPERDIARYCPDIKHLQVNIVLQNITNRRMLNSLQIQTFDHILTLSYSDTLTVKDADALTLVTLLHIQDISKKLNCRLPLVSEMLGVRNWELAKVTRVDDFIVSDRLISLLLSQVSENKNRLLVFNELFKDEGSEIYLKPITNYINPQKHVNFYTLIESAQRQDEVAIGYRISADSNDASKYYGLHINPAKSDIVRLVETDRLIVIAETG